jgi:hypothetical protein
MKDGRGIEIGSVGSEGAVGRNSANVNAPPATRYTYVQVGDGSAQWINRDVLEQFLRENEPFGKLLDRYSRVFLRDIMRSAACNRLHTVEQRCAGWFLSAGDRLGRERFEVSRQFLAGALGVKASSFAVIIRSLSKGRVIEWDGDTCAILNHSRLQKLACPCHQRRSADITSILPGHDEPSPVKHNVIKLVPDIVCDICQSSVDLPHLTHHQCIVALDRQIMALYQRQKELARLRHRVVELRLDVVRSFIELAKRKAAGGAAEAPLYSPETVLEN